jgi:hypothetical protein
MPVQLSLRLSAQPFDRYYFLIIWCSVHMIRPRSEADFPFSPENVKHGCTSLDVNTSEWGFFIYFIVRCILRYIFFILILFSYLLLPLFSIYWALTVSLSKSPFLNFNSNIRGSWIDKCEIIALKIDLTNLAAMIFAVGET